jgi:hypothetical protein
MLSGVLLSVVIRGATNTTMISVNLTTQQCIPDICSQKRSHVHEKSQQALH